MDVRQMSHQIASDLVATVTHLHGQELGHMLKRKTRYVHLFQHFTRDNYRSKITYLARFRDDQYFLVIWMPEDAAIMLCFHPPDEGVEPLDFLIPAACSGSRDAEVIMRDGDGLVVIAPVREDYYRISHLGERQELVQETIDQYGAVSRSALERTDQRWTVAQAEFQNLANLVLEDGRFVRDYWMDIVLPEWTIIAFMDAAGDGPPLVQDLIPHLSPPYYLLSVRGESIWLILTAPPNCSRKAHLFGLGLWSLCEHAVLFSPLEGRGYGISVSSGVEMFESARYILYPNGVAMDVRPKKIINMDNLGVTNFEELKDYVEARDVEGAGVQA